MKNRNKGTDASGKRSLWEDWRLLARGMRILREFAPQYFFYGIVMEISGVVSPYFTLYLSAQLVNELAGQCRPRRLLLLAGIAVLGMFAIKAFRRMVQAKCALWHELAFRQMENYIFQQQHGLQYEHLENAEVSLLREKIFSAVNASGYGLWALFGIVSGLVSGVLNLIVSASLTFSMFRMAAQVPEDSFLAFVDSPACAVSFAAFLLAHTLVQMKCAKAYTKKTMRSFAGLAEENTLYSALFETHGEDVAIFHMKKILIREAEKRLSPAWLREWQKNKLRYGLLDVLQAQVLNLAVLLVTSAKAFLGVFGIGSFLLYRGTAERFVNAFVALTGWLVQARENNEYLLQLYQFLDLPNRMYQGSLAVEKRDDIDYEIEFRNVSFRYPNTEDWVLRNVDMKLRIGEKLAIVGENGSGKTTFIKLLCRLYDPTEGTILLNGIDITRYRYEEYLALFSVVFQDYTLFQFSLAANVSGAFDYDRERVEKCLIQAGFGDRLSGLEKGIETVMGRDYENDGIDLSGGEEQKVALARALYKDAPFVILDEPTAALDPKAEAAVYENFQRAAQDKTAVFISHRLSSCRFCDDIIVFDRGRLVQRGRHDALASQEGKYRQLWEAQAQYYA